MFEEIADGIWHATYDHAPGGVQFRTRATLVRLADGGLWMHSPIPIDDALAEQVDSLGEVRHVVAPNGWHDLFSAQAKARYPNATLWASPALRESKSPLPVDAWLGEADPPWSAELRPHAIEGVPKAQEFVFLHARSGTLIVTDLLFQIRYPVNTLTKIVLWMVGAHGGKLAQSRLWRLVTKDRAAAGRSVREMLEWDFERVVLAHGDFVQGHDARERTRSAL
ncbi:MAG: DUF4336 domain-containing protein, partial [Myxococcota bacterium]